jgi:hypothetical protein
MRGSLPDKDASIIPSIGHEAADWTAPDVGGEGAEVGCCRGAATAGEDVGAALFDCRCAGVCTSPRLRLLFRIVAGDLGTAEAVPLCAAVAESAEASAAYEVYISTLI